MAVGGRAVVEVDHVGAVRAGPRLGPDRPDAEPDVDVVALERLERGFGVARMVGGDEPLARLDHGDGHAEPGVDLGQLDPGRAAAQHEQAARQLAGAGRVLVRPGVDGLDPLDRRQLRPRADGDDHVLRLELVARVVVADRDLEQAITPAVEPSLTAEDGRAGRLEGSDVARVVGVVAVLAVDHVVAPGRGAGPVVVTAGGVAIGRVEQRLRGDAAPERARSAEQVPIDHGDRRAPCPGLVGGRLAARAGADDDEVERVHVGRSPAFWRVAGCARP